MVIQAPNLSKHVCSSFGMARTHPNLLSSWIPLHTGDDAKQE